MNPDTPEREMMIRQLQFLLKTYDGCTDLIAKTKQRLLALDVGTDAKLDQIIGGEGAAKGLEYTKGNIARRIEKLIQNWPIYSKWMVNIPGCGPAIAGKLIMLYYYKFTPICQKCGGEMVEFTCTECGQPAKGDGLLKHRIDTKEFSNVSKWWHYLGRHCAYSEKHGKAVMPKRASGVKCDWSTEGRTITYHLADQFVRQSKGKPPYRAFYDDRKKKRLVTHPEASDGHRNNMAKNETVKLFLSHFWHVARELEGLSTAGPYADVIMGHTGIIAPYYWPAKVEKAA